MTHQQSLTVFHLGGRPPPALAVDGRGMRPACFAPFHDLTRLRYDFPLLLREGEATDTTAIEPLSALIDAVLAAAAPRGAEGERMRQTVLRAERELRRRLAEGRGTALSALWQEAREQLVGAGGEAADQDLARAWASLAAEGTLVDCDEAMPARVLRHAWQRVQAEKLARLQHTIESLIGRLGDLVRADWMRSGAGRQADALRAGVGSAHRALFDFDRMAQVLARPSGDVALPARRRQRIEAVLGVLRTQRFCGAGDIHGWEFQDVDAALEAYRSRLPEMAALVRAMSIAGLELEGRYAEARHDALFDGFDAEALGAQDLAQFPDPVVWVGHAVRGTRARLLEGLAEGVPLKVLCETGELFDATATGGGHLGFGAQLAASVLALDEVFVLQSASASLPRMRAALWSALRYRGPALVSVYAPRGVRAPGLPAYLVSTAARASRAFPSFVYDPSGGEDWADRFTLADNPQPGQTWAREPFAYVDADEQRVNVSLAFTFADFVLCEHGGARHFARVPVEDWSETLVPLDAWLAAPPSAGATLPVVCAVDADQRLHKLVVGERLAQETRRCAQAWHRLQERDLRARREARSPAPGASATAATVTAADTAPASAAPSEPAAPPAAVDDGAPYIETPRCTSCNECTQLNSTVFAYNENQQAYIARPEAATFRELVEAAESCQVAIIHPGRPRDPNEPGLEELLARAAPFA